MKPLDLQRENDDVALDDALDQTFPASDPLANTVATAAVRPRPAPSLEAVTDNRLLGADVEESMTGFQETERLK